VKEPLNSPAVSAHSASNGPTAPDEPDLLADLDGLIEELGAASAGSAALDLRIHIGFRVALRRAPDLAALLIEQGVTWPTVEAVMEEQVAPYTTSLDAALDGEDISFVVRSARRQRWAAMQKAADGAEILAWAASEPLARRLAAISVRRHDLANARAAAERLAPASAEAAHEASSGKSLGETSGDAPLPAEKEWEVSF